MRYLLDKEFRPARPQKLMPDPSPAYATALRRELAVRNLAWARDRGCPHELTLGRIPAVLYREDEHGEHGNFLTASYRELCARPLWKRRLAKVHTSARRSLLSHDPKRCELDSSNSSDALLMNVFCHPETLASQPVRSLLHLEHDAEAFFGHKPRIPLVNQRSDRTEVDLKLGHLFVEAKLTEYDFQQAPRDLLDRYVRFADVFDIGDANLCGATVESYQLIRGVLAADAHSGHRFCVLCDARRPDLIRRWHRVMRMVLPYDLRCRLLLLTWQELAAVLPPEVQAFLGEKYGIVPA